MAAVGYIPYCGAAPLPGGAVWNLELHLLIALALGAVAYSLWARGGRAAPREVAAFAVGWLILALALVSPLCNLSVALFSARVAQHMLIVLVAVPTLVLGGSDRALFGAGSAPGRREAIIATIGFGAALWFWHMPRPYDATFRSDVVYWAMHLTMLVAALALWRVLLRAAPGAVLTASVITGAQMAGLGALLALSNTALFSVHALTSSPWGLTPEQDQSVGGLIMWVPGGLILTVEVLLALAAYLNALDRRQEA